MPGPWCRHSRCRPPIPRPMPGCSKTSPPGASATRPTSRSIAATSMPPAAGSGWTSPAAPICSAARRRCGRTCSPVCAARVWLRPRRSPIRPAPPGRSPVTVQRRSCRRAAPGWRWRLCPWRRSAWTPIPSRCWSAWGSSGSRVSIPCRAGRWSRALATRSPRVSIRQRAWSTSRSRRAPAALRTAPSWPSPSRSPRPTRSRR